MKVAPWAYLQGSTKMKTKYLVTVTFMMEGKMQKIYVGEGNALRPFTALRERAQQFEQEQGKAMQNVLKGLMTKNAHIGIEECKA